MKLINRPYKFIVTLLKGFRILFLLFIFLSCGEEAVEELPLEVNSRISPEYDGPRELAYCEKDKFSTYENTVTLTGMAQFQRRELSYQGLGGPSEGIPIRYAEVRVVESDGSLVQCGETNFEGRFELKVPKDSRKIYVVKVNSRADNENVKVSVLNAPELNQTYSLRRPN